MKFFLEFDFTEWQLEGGGGEEGTILLSFEVTEIFSL